MHTIGPEAPGPPTVAGNNVALYAQLRRTGWSVAEIERVGVGYRVSLELVSGQYRANGKPFIDHFVGTASVVAAAGGRPALVRAALVHNAYAHGIWRSGRPRATPVRRREVQAAIGVDAEALVLGYERHGWREDDIERLLARADELTERERDLTVLRLANEIEDRTDLGLLLSRRHRRPLEPMIELAGGIDQPFLADWLSWLRDEEAGAVVEPGLCHDAHGVEVIPPPLVPPPDRRCARRLVPSLSPGGRPSPPVDECSLTCRRSGPGHRYPFNGAQGSRSVRATQS